MVSESFTNDAVTGTVSYPKTVGSGSASSTAAALTIVYDAPSSSYTVTTAGRSQTYAPANLDGSIVSPEITVYKKVAGNVTDTLTITKPGTAGALTYRYVGAGFWQRTVDGTATVSGSLDSFTYGVTTPDAAVPRTGNAVYAIDLLGTTAYLDGLFSLRGTGAMLFKFGSNSFSVEGSYREIAVETGLLNATYGFSGTGTVSSTNAFSGTLGSPAFSGPLAGRFYGPQAEELGGAFRFTNAGVATTGTITGRAQVLDASASGSFRTTGSALSFVTDGSGAVVGYNGEARPPFDYSVDAGTGQRVVADGFGVSATFPAASRVVAESNAVFTSYKVVDGTRTDTLLLYNPGSGNTQLALRYASFGYWRQSKPNIVATRTDVADRFFVYGQKTPNDFVPKTGTGSYSGLLYGRAIAASFAGGAATINAPVQFEVGGTIRLNFDFAAQSVGGSVDPTLTNLSDRTTASWGSYAIFGGTFFNANGLFTSNYGGTSGALTGNIYGANAEEAAGSFSMSAPFQTFGNIVAQGVFVAKKN